MSFVIALILSLILIKAVVYRDVYPCTAPENAPPQHSLYQTTVSKQRGGKKCNASLRL